jgi:hypothetical protein
MQEQSGMCRNSQGCAGTVRDMQEQSGMCRNSQGCAGTVRDMQEQSGLYRNSQGYAGTVRVVQEQSWLCRNRHECAMFEEAKNLRNKKNWKLICILSFWLFVLIKTSLTMAYAGVVIKS